MNAPFFFLRQFKETTSHQNKMFINLKQNFEETVALIGRGGFCEELALLRREE